MLFHFHSLLQHNSLMVWISETVLASIVIEVTHYFSFFVFVGAIGIVDLRILGVAAKNQTASQLAERLFPWIWLAMGLNFLTGFLQYAGDALEYYDNRIMHIVLLICLAGVVLAVVIQASVGRWEQSPSIPVGAKLVAFFSLVLWLGAILASVEVPAITGVG
jgi:hypothetical protein